MLSSLTQREYVGWQRYWQAEPWGVYRDNLHTAIIAREIRRPQQARGSHINPDQFMISSAAARRAAAEHTLWTTLALAASKPKESDSDG